jgi:thymidylate synthase (FAD)|tara:strand:- start:6580 stop:7266 length:687 start_codon:yes stop_codon:yes gene_type:complete
MSSQLKATLVDSMGTDLTVANAARVSFNKESSFDVMEMGVFLKSEDQRLLDFLARNDHFTPFTHCMITMREKVPLFVARQRFKHTVGFSYNEVSRRYVDYEPEFYIPEDWRAKADDRKQGSLDDAVDINSNNLMVDEYKQSIDKSKWTYEHLLRLGVCPEQARMVLPQSMYTEYFVTGSLYAWSRAYLLRSSETAQKEIRELAEEWHNIIIKLFPQSWVSLTNINNGG